MFSAFSPFCYKGQKLVSVTGNVLLMYNNKKTCTVFRKSCIVLTCMRLYKSNSSAKLAGKTQLNPEFRTPSHLVAETPRVQKPESDNQ